MFLTSQVSGPTIVLDAAPAAQGGHMPEHIYIGRRNGIDWICYREPGDTARDFKRRAIQMRDALTLVTGRGEPPIETTGETVAEVKAS